MGTAAALSPASGNILLGKGVLYFDRFDTNGAKTGEQHLGNCTQFSIEPKVEMETIRESMTPASGIMKQIVKYMEMNISITAEEFSLINMAIALLGDQASLTQTGASISAGAEQPVASSVQGRYYPLAYRKVSAVTVKFGSSNYAGAATADVTDDYTLDATTGRIYIVPGGAITDGSKVWVDYTYATIDLDKIRAATVPNVAGFLRFVGNPAAGPTYEAELWNVQLAPGGKLDLIGDNHGQVTLTGAVMIDLANHPTEPFGRLINVV